MGFPAGIITTLHPVWEAGQENLRIFLTMKSGVHSRNFTLPWICGLWALGLFGPGMLSVALWKPGALPFTYSYPTSCWFWRQSWLALWSDRRRTDLSNPRTPKFLNGKARIILLPFIIVRLYRENPKIQQDAYWRGPYFFYPSLPLPVETGTTQKRHSVSVKWNWVK